MVTNKLKYNHIQSIYGGFIMLNAERSKKILELLRKNKSMQNKDLIKELYISEATLRRDLTQMERQGFLQRTHGGAILRETLTVESSLNFRTQAQIKEKKRIAQATLNFITSDTSYFFDSSSTVGQLIPLLNAYNNLTIVTNGLSNALLLSTQTSKTTLYIAPGEVDYKTSSILGVKTIEFIEQFNCNTFIFSCSGISLFGVSEANHTQSLIKKCMLDSSKTHILIADSSKFGKVFLSQTCHFDDIDYLITDKLPDKDYIELFKRSHTKLIIA